MSIPSPTLCAGINDNIHVSKRGRDIGIPITSVASSLSLGLNCRGPGAILIVCDLIITSTLGWEMCIMKPIMPLNV